ncbi:MAG: M3 family oligoendopeptidase [Phycisphaerae bacterium]
MSLNPTKKTPVRTFVPAEIDFADWSQLQPLFDQLAGRELGSRADLERWLLDLSELYAAIDEFGSRRYIAKTCHTEDEAIKEAFMHFVEHIEPKLKPVMFEMKKKFAACPHKDELTDAKYEILKRQWETDVEIYREENVPLQTTETKLITEYDEYIGAMMVEFRGKERTLPQMGKFLEETDRATREEAWTLTAERRLKDRQKLDTIFDELLKLRQQIAENAGFADYRAYTFKALHRFDYTPEDCHAFAEAVEAEVVPMIRELDAQRRSELKLDALRPWDLGVDLKGREPLQPFDENDIDGFVAKTREIFHRLSPALAAEFDELKHAGNLDLDSRRGKAPGGYQAGLPETGVPFIFMNAAGLQRDVETLLHEGGHAFHFMASKAEPVVFLRHAPMEFCEVASMAMELLALPHMDVFFADEAGQARAKRHQLEGATILAWIATIDQFQHWLYTNPGHSSEARRAKWLEIFDRFGHDVDYTGHEDAKEWLWQRQLHLYHVPFYYIEYGIAQLGALQLWLKSLQDPHQALANYRNGLKFGGTRSLPELFTATGLQFDFSRKTVGPLAKAVRQELAALPA